MVPTEDLIYFTVRNYWEPYLLRKSIKSMTGLSIQVKRTVLFRLFCAAVFSLRLRRPGGLIVQLRVALPQGVPLYRTVDATRRCLDSVRVSIGTPASAWRTG